MVAPGLATTDEDTNECERTQSLMFKILRATAGSMITFQDFLDIDGDVRIALREGSDNPVVVEEQLDRIRRAMRKMQTDGFGRIFGENETVQKWRFRKYSYVHLSRTAMENLQHYRIHFCLFQPTMTKSKFAKPSSQSVTASQSRCKSADMKKGSCNKAAAVQKLAQQPYRKLSFAEKLAVKTMFAGRVTHVDLSHDDVATIALAKLEEHNEEVRYDTFRVKPEVDGSVQLEARCVGTRELECPVRFRIQYFPRDIHDPLAPERVAYEQHHMIITMRQFCQGTNPHNHELWKLDALGDTPERNSKFGLEPILRHHAKLFLKTCVSSQDVSAIALQKCFKIALSRLAPSAKLRSWLNNYRTSAKKFPDRIPCLAEKVPAPSSALPAASLFTVTEKIKFAEWPVMDESVISKLVSKDEDTKRSTSRLYVLNKPAPICEVEALSVSFLSHGMAETIVNFDGIVVCLAYDPKQGLFSNHSHHCVGTTLLLVKDCLRTTDFASKLPKPGAKKQMKAKERRVQAPAYTSHGKPLAQNVQTSECGKSVVNHFQALCILWRKLRPHDKPLEERDVQLHKDYGLAIELARRTVFKRSRPVNDWYHFAARDGTLRSKIRDPENVAVTRLLWQCLRRLPTFDLQSALLDGALQKLRVEMGEADAAEYLGPRNLQEESSTANTGGTAQHPYCVRDTLEKLKEMYNVTCWENDMTVEMTFMYAWDGIGGIVAGSSCGSTAAEAFHSPWQSKTKDPSLGKLAHKNWVGLDILHQMQGIFNTTWRQSFAWGGPQGPQSLQPPKRDPHTIASEQYLNKAGRTTARQFHTEWQRKPSIIFESIPIEGHVQITAMPRTLMKRDSDGMYDWRTDNAGNVECDFCVEDAQAGIELMFLHGEDLRSRLHHHGLLRKGPDGEDLTDEKRIVDVFLKVAYVITCDSSGRQHLRGFRDQGFADNAESRRLCTCKWYCRYSGCEHRDMADFLPSPLRPIPQEMENPSSIAAPKRGRKTGSARTTISAKRRGRPELLSDAQAAEEDGKKCVRSKKTSRRGTSADQDIVKRAHKKARISA